MPNGTHVQFKHDENWTLRPSNVINDMNMIERREHIPVVAYLPKDAAVFFLNDFDDVVVTQP
jgi:hypothetical protein